MWDLESRELIKTRNGMSSKGQDETDGRFHARRDRLASEPAIFVPRAANDYSNTMAVQSGMLMELNNTEPQ